MTPSRAVMIFKNDAKHGKHGHKREALPWWILASLLGGILTYEYGPELLEMITGTPLPPVDQHVSVSSLQEAIQIAKFATPGVVVRQLSVVHHQAGQRGTRA